MALDGGIFSDSIKALLDGDASDHTYDSAGMLIALYDNTPAITAGSFDAVNAAYDAGDWVTANEVYGTGWAQGGVALSTPALTVGSPAAGQLKFDAVDTSETGTTLADIYGCLIYDGSATSPADAAICAVDFSGAPYSTSNGTLAITWDTNGIFYIDLVPA